MRDVIFLLIGVCGGMIGGVVMMCLLQINRINQYEKTIMLLKKQLKAKEKKVGGDVCEKSGGLCNGCRAKGYC